VRPHHDQVSSTTLGRFHDGDPRLTDLEQHVEPGAGARGELAQEALDLAPGLLFG